MEMNLRKLLQNREETPEHSGVLDFSDSNFPGYAVRTPVAYTLVAQPEGSAIRLKLSLSGTLNAICGRCAEPVDETVAFKTDYLVRETDLDDPDTDLPLTPDGQLDVNELVYQELLTGAPSVLLCREDCEGLCPQCGRRKAVCTCPPEAEGDPRLQVLKSLLAEDD